MSKLEISQGRYAKISELAFALQRDINMAAGPNPIDPRLARARQNATRLVEELKEVQILPETVPADDGPQGFFPTAPEEDREDDQGEIWPSR